MHPARRLRAGSPRTTNRLDFRLFYVVLAGLSGVIVLFRFVISTSVVEAAVLSLSALAIALLIAWRALPPWSGSDQGKVVVLCFLVAQLMAVLLVAVLVK